MKRLLALSPLRRVKPAQPELAGAKEPPMNVEAIKARMLELLKDCESPASARTSYRLEQCVTATELWLMRSDIYQAVANHHSQTEARQRVNALLPCFKGWLPSTQLTKVK